MDPGSVAPMVASVTLFVVTGLVILLRPISKKLGSVLEAIAEEKRRNLSVVPMAREDAARIATMLDTIDRRLAHLEERQDFTDKLLVERQTQRLER
jgi:hypothetical protein